MVRIAAIIVNFRTPELVKTCLQALGAERAMLPHLDAIVVDGGSGDESAEKLAELTNENEYKTWTQLLPLPLNGGFGWANNQGISLAMSSSPGPDFIYLLNPDAVVQPGAVSALADLLTDDPTAAVVGSQLLTTQGAETPSAFRFPTPLGEFVRGSRSPFLGRLLGMDEFVVRVSGEAVEADWVTGASSMFRVEALRESGLFDEGFFLYHEEVELMSRIKALGWTIWHEPRSRVVHLEGASTGIGEHVAGDKLLPRRPRYWYESRRRMFSLMYDPLRARGAVIAWALGHLLWRLRRGLGLGRQQPIHRCEFRDQLAVGLSTKPFDQVKAIPDFVLDITRAPAWQKFSQ